MQLLRGAARHQFLESRLHARQRNHTANCRLTILEPDKKFLQALPGYVYETCGVC